MNEIVYSGLTLFNMGQWFWQRKAAPGFLNFLLLDDDDLSSEKADTMLEQLDKRLIHYEKENITIPEFDTEETSTKERRKGDDISRRTYQCLYDKILYRITLGYQYTDSVNPPLSMEDISSVNAKPLQTVEHSNFWAVIIGINAYQSCPLQGCVSDALLVEKYLKEEIGVPQDRIHLIDNPQIEVGDNIIIYFSRHSLGYSTHDYHLGDAEDNRSLGGMDESIKAICPIDRDAIDSSGLRVPDISDREINSIFQQISHSKGHRITFFLDSCHSGTHVRCFPEPGTRTVPPLPRASLRRMLHIADKNLSQYPSYKSILESDWKPDMSSHVIIAACKEYQIVREVESETGYNGIFTRALVDALRSGNLSEESTYIDLLCSLPLRGWQTPVAAGKNKRDRLWFKN
ncbi:uncharacterized protein ARMOST_22275 [Armillaria ostoyae]|uniref:Peptidase C14 caspase domain-containing protein n=1 Tax=Armillaria ostoyae TaxID=47428 RepID=A0A284SCF0_ARMOS|nr:uncharacterized protein ARMOST_22275 [Armillaria ostoyae]